MKKAPTLALACLCALGLAFFARADTAENMEIVYAYLTETLGYNRAAACGIMSNIQYESNFRPEAIGDGGNAYGICQWNSRRQSLINYCERNGFESWQDIYGQLGYLGYELENNKKRVGAYLASVPDTPQGAYDAGYYFCVYFEIPANRFEKGVKRGSTAVTKYFVKYGGALETYTVKYDARGGAPAPGDEIKTEGVPLTVSQTEPALKGWHFGGWTTDRNSRESEYQPGDRLFLNHDVTLYALWQPVVYGSIEYTLRGGAYAVTGYSGNLSEISVPDEVDGIRVTAIAKNAFTGAPAGCVVYIPSGVTLIEEGAFAESAMLAALPGSAAQAYALRYGLGFMGVYSAGTLKLSGVSCIEPGAFAGTNIKTADLSDCAVSRLESGVFEGCGALEKVILPASVTYIAPDAIPEGVKILAPEGSYAQRFALESGYEFGVYR